MADWGARRLGSRQLCSHSQQLLFPRGREVLQSGVGLEGHRWSGKEDQRWALEVTVSWAPARADCSPSGHTGGVTGTGHRQPVQPGHRA